MIMEAVGSFNKKGFCHRQGMYDNGISEISRGPLSQAGNV